MKWGYCNKHKTDYFGHCALCHIEDRHQASMAQGSIHRCEKHHRDYNISVGCPECSLSLPPLESVIHIAGDHGNRTMEEISQEFDPNGKKASDPGSKLDGGKPLAGELVLSFPRALEALVQVATYGAGKYSRQGFLQVPNAKVRYLDACMRHLLKYGQGEHLDPESGLPHIDHALWNVAAIVELGRRKDQSEDAMKKFEEIVFPKERTWNNDKETKTPLRPAAPPAEEG